MAQLQREHASQSLPGATDDLRWQRQPAVPPAHPAGGDARRS